MKRVTFALAVLLGMLALTVTGTGAQGISGGPTTVGIVTMDAQHDSGQDGSATFSEVDGKVVVSVKLANGTSEPQPAHIHKGTCANLDPKPAYPLTNVVNGMSETTLDVSMDTLLSGEYAINAHKSAKEVATYVSCGDLTMMARAGGTNSGGGVGMPATGNGEQTGMLVLMGLAALTLVGSGVAVARRTK